MNTLYNSIKQTVKAYAKPLIITAILGSGAYIGCSNTPTEALPVANDVKVKIASNFEAQKKKVLEEITSAEHQYVDASNQTINSFNMYIKDGKFTLDEQNEILSQADKNHETIESLDGYVKSNIAALDSTCTPEQKKEVDSAYNTMQKYTTTESDKIASELKPYQALVDLVHHNVKGFYLSKSSLDDKLNQEKLNIEVEHANNIGHAVVAIFLSLVAASMMSSLSYSEPKNN